MPQSQLTDLIAASLEVDSVEGVHTLCARICRSFGFEHFIYGASFPSSFVKPFMLIVSGYPDDWREHYNRNNYLAVDPVVMHATRSVRPLRWSELRAREASDPQIGRFMQEAREFGLRSGLTVPLHGLQGERAVFSLCTADESADAERRIAEAMAPVYLLTSYLQEAIQRVVSTAEFPLQHQQLTAREHECLLWAAEGKTSWETAQILGISERTVTFHLQKAGEKLECANRQQAVARAIAQGLITPKFA